MSNPTLPAVWTRALAEPAAAPAPAPEKPARKRTNRDESGRIREILDHLNPSRADDYHEWLAVGMALHADAPANHSLWEAWSKQSSKYKAGECAAKWETFGLSNGSAVTLGTILEWARQDSGKPDLGKRSARKNAATAKGADYQDPAADEQEEKRPKKNQSTLLVELAEAEGVEFFHTPDREEPFASFVVQGHRETWELRSRNFKTWLARRFYLVHGKAIGSQAQQDAIDQLSAKARFEGPALPVAVRLFEMDGTIWLDLGDPAWKAVAVTTNGWRVVERPAVRFVRPKGFQPLPEPIREGRVADLWDFVNVAEADRALVLAWLVGALRPQGPFAGLGMSGEAGSAKSTTARLLKRLVDPAFPILRATPREERDLMIAARNGWVISFDNLSGVPPWLSDALCRLATGGGFATRTLYSDEGETLFEAARPILLNGIDEVATRSDLVSRCITINLPTIPDHQRRTEADVLAAFERCRAGILGALLDAVVAAHRGWRDVKLTKLPRMADFFVWAVAAEKALGLPVGSIEAAYRDNQAAGNELALESDVVAAVLVSFVGKRITWTGTATELKKALEVHDREASKRDGWPKSPNNLSGRIKRLAPNLRALGLEVWRDRGSDKHRGRLIHLEWRGNVSSGSSDSSGPLRSPPDAPTAPPAEHPP